MADEDPSGSNIMLYPTEVRWRRDDQIRRLTALEQKLVTAFTLNVAVIALFGASLGIAGGPFPLIVECLVYVTVFLFTVGVIVSTRVYLSTRWSRTPDLDYFLRQLYDHEPKAMEEWLAEEITRGLADNEGALDTKSRDTGIAVLLAAGTALLVGVTAAAYLALRVFS